jgi:DNA-binding NtrC family response regulator
MTKILYAEDDRMTSEIVLEKLKDSFPDMEIEHFRDGEKLANRLEKGACDFSFVITDENMPYLYGSEIIKKYSKINGYEKIPFVLFFGGDPKTGEQAIKEGAIAYIRKSHVAIEELIKLMKEKLPRE